VFQLPLLQQQTPIFAILNKILMTAAISSCLKNTVSWWWRSVANEAWFGMQVEVQWMLVDYHSRVVTGRPWWRCATFQRVSTWTVSSISSVGWARLIQSRCVRLTILSDCSSRPPCTRWSWSTRMLRLLNMNHRSVWPKGCLKVTWLCRSTWDWWICISMNNIGSDWVRWIWVSTTFSNSCSKFKRH